MVRGFNMLLEIGDLFQRAFPLRELSEPKGLVLLLEQIDKCRLGCERDERYFVDQLVALSGPLLAYANSLTRNRDEAADLLQDTIVRALRSRHHFQQGTNLKAWTHMIMRNHFLSGKRRGKFVGEWDDRYAERVLIDEPDQERAVDLDDLRRAVDTLPAAQRQALRLIAELGQSYEEAAACCAVPIGTIKSRVSRAKRAVTEMLEGRASMPTRSADLPRRIVAH